MSDGGVIIECWMVGSLSSVGVGSLSSSVYESKPRVT